MSGSNSNMSLVTKVAEGLDGTNASLTPFSWTCPEVTPYSDIYFYQVSSRLYYVFAFALSSFIVHKQRVFSSRTAI